MIHILWSESYHRKMESTRNRSRHAYNKLHCNASNWRSILTILEVHLQNAKQYDRLKVGKAMQFLLGTMLYYIQISTLNTVQRRKLNSNKTKISHFRYNSDVLDEELKT